MTESGSRSGWIRSFLGPLDPDPDPYFENRIRGSGSEKMDRIRNTMVKRT